MEWFLVLVDAHPDEAQRIDQGRANAGLAWLEDGLAEGWIASAGAYPHTGGYMVVGADSRAAFDELLAGYPLRETIDVDVRPVVPLRQGFAVLAGNIEAARSGVAAVAGGSVDPIPGDEDRPHDQGGVEPQVQRVGH